jgi:hypothetical protein
VLFAGLPYYLLWRGGWGGGSLVSWEVRYILDWGCKSSEDWVHVLGLGSEEVLNATTVPVWVRAIPVGVNFNVRTHHRGCAEGYYCGWHIFCPSYFVFTNKTWRSISLINNNIFSRSRRSFCGAKEAIRACWTREGFLPCAVRCSAGTWRWCRQWSAQGPRHVNHIPHYLT